jgi:hypothetical protein
MSEPGEHLERAKEYRRLADYYYDNYHEFYIAKEYSKASEFIWGTVNALSNGLSLLLQGKELYGHAEVVRFLKMLVNSYYKSEEVGEGVSAVQKLHANYFHNFMDRDLFEEDGSKAERLLNRLAELLDLKIREVEVSRG